MMYLILTLLVYQAATKYFLTEHEEGPVKHHLIKVQTSGNKAEEKEDETRGEGGGSKRQSGYVRAYLIINIISLTVNYPLL